jgi:hypothetical protein
METKRPKEQPENLDQFVREAKNAFIGEQVIHALGTPVDLLEVQVRRLWEGQYRANVFVGADITSARVAHSYFLKVDDNGTILASSPKLARQYGPLPVEAPNPI